MSTGAPTAVINGIERFGAGKLATLLIENDIEVVGIGNFVDELKGLKNFSLVGSVEDLDVKAEYYFDFQGDVSLWQKAEIEDSKLAIIGINKTLIVDSRLRELRVNWRIINIHGVYGSNMEGVLEEVGEIEYLIKAIKLAVGNKNLILPPRKTILRLMTENDLTEVVMRSCFLSGTEREVFEIWGGEITSEELAKTLIDEAKMTRFKVEESDSVELANYKFDKDKIEAEWRRLRWRPSDNWSEAIKETLQSYFVRADEESRKPKKNTTEKLQVLNNKDSHIENQLNKKIFEVEIEEEEKIDNLQSTNFNLQIAKKEVVLPMKTLQQIIEEEYSDEGKRKENNTEEVSKVEEEKFEEEESIRPFLIKNSNMRPVQTTEDNIQTTNYNLQTTNFNLQPINFNLQKEEEKKDNLQSSDYKLQSTNFSLQSEEENLQSIPQEDSLRRANFNLQKEEEKKVEIKDEVRLEKKKILNKKNILGKIKIVKVDWMRWGWRIMAGMWGFVLLLVILWVFNVVSIFQNTYKIRNLITEKKYEAAEKLIVKNEKKINSQEAVVINWGWNRLVWGRRYQEILKILDQGMVLASKASSLSKRSELLGQAVFEDKSIDWNKELGGFKFDLVEAEDAMGTIGARLSGDWRWVPARWRGGLGEITQQVARSRELMGWGIKMVDILPEILGTDGKRREYMVLLQNENELRATGGFVGSYGILSFEGGKLINFEIQDIYEADGQLKGHVEPPEPLKTYLGEAAWFMRDSNWQVDFTAASKDIQWFLEKETSRKVDGVVGINLAVVKAMLGVVGEIYVPDFKEKINKNNLYEQAEFYSETNSFAGSNQKASFLGGLGKQLFESIKTMKGENKLSLMMAVLETLEKNEMILSLNEPKAASVVAGLGWNGAMNQLKCFTKNCFADYLYVVESNFGVNKVNYFLYRNIDETIDISNKTIGRVVKISYENTAKSSAWPGGDYKNYMRIYIPQTANVAEVSVTNPVGGQKTIYNGENLRINTVMGKKEVGMLVTVPKGEKRVFELRYVDQIDLKEGEKFNYIHYIQKQPGFGDTGLVSLISMPDGWQANQVEPNATLVNGKLLFNQKLDKNIKIGIEIVK